MTTPLDHIRGLDPARMERLLEQWITTAEQLAGLGVSEHLTGRLAERLGISQEAVAAILQSAREVALAPGGLASSQDIKSFGMGLHLLDDARARRLAAQDPFTPAVLTRTAPAPGLPTTINHTPALGVVRDQGDRGTCVAFASCAAREFLDPGHTDLSEQFFYWACKQRDNLPAPGTTFEAAIEAMRKDGVCREATWPYNIRPGDDEGGGMPPKSAQKEATQYVWPDAAEFASRMDYIKAILAGASNQPAQPLVIGVLVFESSFFTPDVIEWGRITLPFRGESYLGGHAVCVAGYKDDPQVPGGGYLIIRNSWGARWGRSNEYGAGYGMMPYAYARLYCLGAYSLAGRYPRFSAGQPETGAEKTTSSPASTTIIPGDTNHSSTETPEPQAPEPQTYEPQAPAAADETPALLPNEQNDLERYLRSKSTAVLAILFSDIEGYTPLSEKQGEITMSKVREFFSKVTHECAQRDGAGWVVKNMGDSFLCVFAEPSVAVARALEMQEHFRAFRLKDAGASGQANDALRVRMGLDMGQVTLEGSLQMDVFGRHVTRAARVMALAGGGQIYLTRAVFDSAQGWLKEWEERGLKWEDHGAWRIKGFEGPVGIYEAVDTRHAGPRSPLGAVRAGGVEMAGAKGAGTNPQTTNRCSVCQKEYASRLSLAAACEVCGALICQACGRAGNRKRCREHERSAS